MTIFSMLTSSLRATTISMGRAESVYIYRSLLSYRIACGALILFEEMLRTMAPPFMLAKF